jgi:hypothetical protein
MTDSLLVTLRSYRPRAGRDPLEDFVTEAFAWTLRTHPALGATFLDAVCERAGVEPAGDEVEWTTQVRLESGIADMIARQGNQMVLFEHKMHSPATAKQVDRYRRALENESDDNVVTVLITASRWNYEGPQNASVQAPNVRLAWGEVYRLLDRAAEAGLDDRSRVDDFLALLKYEGLGPREPLSEPALRAFAASRHVTDTLYDIIERVRTGGDWSFAFGENALPTPETNALPGRRWTPGTRSGGRFKSGRIAIDFGRWVPGVLAGLIVDPGNIKTKLVDPESGPDLAVFIGLPVRGMGKSYRSIVTGEAYRGLGDGIRKAVDDAWTVAARGPNDPTFQKWHPIVIQRPLAYVLRGKETREEQRQAVYNVLREGVEAFVHQPVLHDLRAQIREAVGEKA